MNEGRATPILDTHVRLGARLTDFAGWDMPLQYSGIIAEHNSVRQACGLFDVTHLGKLLVEGDSIAALQHAVTADVDALEPGAATYALVLTEDGGCVDDIFIYRLDDSTCLAVPNAANVAAVRASIEESGGTVDDVWDRWAILALQGPDSFEMLERVIPDTGATAVPLHRFVEWGDGLIARTGYTGERGFELYVPWGEAAATFERFIDAGVAAVGLGARDTLRLEMGYALYGHELTLDINPLEAGLGWAVSWAADFRGRTTLEKIRADGPARKTFGIVCSGKGVPRQGYPVFVGEVEVGALTSGNHSPTLGTGIAIALGPSDAKPEPGSVVEIEARGRRIPGDIVKPPFVGRGKKPQVDK